MKKTIIAFLALCLTFVAIGTVGCDGTLPEAKDVGAWQVASPDGTICADLKIDAENKITYSVSKGNVTVVEPSELGFTVKQDDLRVFSVDKAETKRISGEYENISGKSAKVQYDCNELTLTLKNYVYYVDVIVRAYDDGYAFRYGIRRIDGSTDEIEVISENSEFALPSGSDVWAEVYQSTVNGYGIFSYERTYENRKSTNFGGESLAFPLLYKVKGTSVYSLISESDLIGSGYYGSFLQEREEDKGTGKFKTIHSPAGAAENDNFISAPFRSPWRVGIVGDMKTVVESELVEKVYDDCEYWKPDNYDELSEEEKKIYNYDWVETGASAWSWLVEWKLNKRGETNYDMHKEYVDAAAEHGWKYVILDAGWDSGFNSTYFNNFAEFMNYADSKNVKVMVWCDSLADFAYGNLDSLRAKLDDWASKGIAGIKIDFFDGQNALKSPHWGEDTETIQWYEHIYQECAKRKMVVNCHGCNKPTGERRKYPNVITREAVRGNEFSVDSTTTVNQMFTRAVIGPSDWTPRIYPFPYIKLTVAHQMALAVLFESGTPTMADFAENYYKPEFTDFYRSLPALRDKTVFISGEPDGYFCAAIKSGNDWFVAGINSYDTVDVDIDFSFLDDGSYAATLYTDVEIALNRNQEINKTSVEGTIGKNTKKSVSMYENGGFIYHLKKISGK